jgi:hypothetical protein
VMNTVKDTKGGMIKKKDYKFWLSKKV